MTMPLTVVRAAGVNICIGNAAIASRRDARSEVPDSGFGDRRIIPNGFRRGAASVVECLPAFLNAGPPGVGPPGVWPVATCVDCDTATRISVKHQTAIVDRMTFTTTAVGGW